MTTRGGLGTDNDAQKQYYYLSDHRKSHDEKGDAAAKSEQWLVRTQVFGELIRNRSHYSLDSGKLKHKRIHCTQGGTGGLNGILTEYFES